MKAYIAIFLAFFCGIAVGYWLCLEDNRKSNFSAIEIIKGSPESEWAVVDSKSREPSEPAFLCEEDQIIYYGDEFQLPRLPDNTGYWWVCDIENQAMFRIVRMLTIYK